jgi:hypothetical protein
MTKFVCFFSHTSQIVAVLNNHHDSLAWLDEKSRYFYTRVSFDMCGVPPVRCETLVKSLLHTLAWRRVFPFEMCGVPAVR